MGKSKRPDSVATGETAAPPPKRHKTNPARDDARALKANLDAKFGTRHVEHGDEPDARVVAGLAAIQCTYEEIAAVVGTSEVTVRKKFGDLVERERLAGRMSLRRAQYQKAVKDGNTAMLIWLGKQFLGQKEKLDTTVTETVPLLVVRRGADLPTTDSADALASVLVDGTGASGLVS